MFCVKCGNESSNNAKFCKHCGNEVKRTQAQTHTPYSGGGATRGQSPQNYMGTANSYPYRTEVIHYAPGSFAERLHSYGGNVLFLVGIILFSAGNLFDIFMNFSTFSFLTLLVLALPITGFWLIFAASKTPKLPEKVLPALTLFKVRVIIDMVLMCMIALVILIIFFMVVSEVIELAVLLLFVFGVIVLYIVFYFRAILRILKDIRDGITTNSFTPLRNVKFFTVITFIIVAFGILGAIIMATVVGLINHYIGDFLFLLPAEFDFISEFLSAGGSLSAFLSIIAYVGTIICIVALNKFNASLK